MRRYPALALVVCSVLLTVVSFAQQQRGPSTPEERTRLANVAKELEETPLANHEADRRWATLWLIEVPDVHVSLCTVNMPWESKYKYSGELMGAMLAGSARYAIQNEQNNPPETAVGLARLQSALTAYRNILASDPKAHSKKMDEILKLSDAGTLAQYVNERWKAECTNKKS